MDAQFLNRKSNFEQDMMDIIKGNIHNADEVLKSNDEVNLENAIHKGEVEVISMEDIKETYGDRFWKGEDVAQVEKNIESLIQKGENEFLEEEEFDALTKAMEDINTLDRKAVAMKRGNAIVYKEIFVQKAAEGTPAEDEE